MSAIWPYTDELLRDSYMHDIQQGPPSSGVFEQKKDGKVKIAE